MTYKLRDRDGVIDPPAGGVDVLEYQAQTRAREPMARVVRALKPPLEKPFEFIVVRHADGVYTARARISYECEPYLIGKGKTGDEAIEQLAQMHERFAAAPGSSP